MIGGDRVTGEAEMSNQKLSHVNKLVTVKMFYFDAPLAGIVIPWVTVRERRRVSERATRSRRRLTHLFARRQQGSTKPRLSSGLVTVETKGPGAKNLERFGGVCCQELSAGNFLIGVQELND